MKSKLESLKSITIDIGKGLSNIYGITTFEFDDISFYCINQIFCLFYILNYGFDNILYNVI